MRITSGGKSARSANAALVFLPSAICCPAMRSAFSSGLLPTISSQLRMASSTVMPEAYIMANVEAKRDRMILRRIGPTSGRLIFRWSIM